MPRKSTKPLSIEYSLSEEGKPIVNADSMQVFKSAQKKRFAGMRVKVTIEPVLETRTAGDNRYLWGVLYEQIMQAFYESGNFLSKEDIHTLFKDVKGWGKLHKDEIGPLGELKRKYDPETGEEIPPRRTTRTMTEDEFIEYCQKIRNWCLEFLNFMPSFKGEVYENSTF